MGIRFSSFGRRGPIRAMDRRASIRAMDGGASIRAMAGGFHQDKCHQEEFHQEGFKQKGFHQSYVRRVSIRPIGFLHTTKSSFPGAEDPSCMQAQFVRGPSR